MSVPVAYLGVILIWSTTPLAIKWSGEEVGFIFGVTARMVIGALLCLLLLLALRVRLPWHREARRTYAAAAMGIFGAMLCTYWGAQYIPSGLISVLYGLTPLVTGLLAAWLLSERFFSVARLSGIGLGLLGLGFIFGADGVLAAQSWQGIAAVLFAVALHSLSGVLVKRCGTELHPLSVNAGALSLAVPAYLLVWWLLDGHWPEHAGLRTLGAIVYLGVFGTALGFVLYFYVLKHLPAGVIALVTLITPVTALLIGHWFNAESIQFMVWLGTGCIIAGLVLYQFGGRMLSGLLRRARV